MKAVRRRYKMKNFPNPEMVPGVVRHDEEGNDKTYEHEVVTAYWLEHYAKDHCSLCGNSGIIDTTNARTATGLRVGGLNYCICPNGQIQRWIKAPLTRR